MEFEIQHILEDVAARKMNRFQALAEIKRLKRSSAQAQAVSSPSPGKTFMRSYRAGEQYLKDHTVFGEQVLLGVTHCSLAVEAARQLCPGRVLTGIRKLLFSEAVIVHPGETADIKVIVEEREGRCFFQNEYRKTGQEQYTQTASGEFVFGTEQEPAFVDLAAVRARVGKTVSKEEIYAREAAGSVISHGPSLQTVLNVSVAGRASLGELSLSEEPGNDGHRYELHPALLDGAIVSATAASEEVEGAFVPFLIKEVILRQTPPRHCFCHAQTVKTGPELFEADMDLCDGNGGVYLSIKGFTCKRAASREHFEKRGQEPAVRKESLSGAEPSATEAAYPVNPGPGGEADRYLSGKFASVLKVRGETIDRKRNFMDLGIDSTSLVTLAQEIERELKIELYPTLFFEYQNLDQLTGYFEETYADQLRKATGAGKTDSAAPSTARRPAAVPIRARETAAVPAIRSVVRDNHARSGPKGNDQVNREIAVIGMAGMFADSPDLKTFWKNIVEKKDLIREIPRDHFDFREWYDPGFQLPDRMYCKWGSFINDVDRFDASFFKISPREAEIMDPQLRLLLQVLYATAEDAGCASRIRGTKTGMYVGVCFHDYEIEHLARGRVDPYWGTGNAATMMSNRPSFYLDLRGPSVTVDTACSSSLVALHFACNALRNGECDMAFVGGTNLLLSSVHYRYFCSIGALSQTGRCHSFDSAADGYVPGEGVASVLLKPLRKAVEDGDRIHGVIKGSAINHGGYTPSVTAPSVRQETEVLLDAWSNAGIEPETIQYLEAHGTGTKLGDPVEINGLKAAFGKHTKKEAFCAIGSAKAHIGHAEGAAGIAGVIKAILSMQNRQIPAMPGFAELNPYIKLDSSPLYINRDVEPWVRPEGTPRRAGVSSFGFGGAYAHAVIEEYETSSEKAADRNEAALIVLSARSEQDLNECARRLVRYLEEETADLTRIAYTLQTGREAMEERLALAVTSTDELRENLIQFVRGESDNGPLHRGRAKGNEGMLAVFAGDDDLRKAIDAWMDKRKYAKLLALWVNGLDIDWNGLYPEGKPLPVSLPTYPFAGQSYWLPLSEPDPGRRSAASSRTLEGREKPGQSQGTAAAADWNGLTYLPLWQEEAAQKSADTAFSGLVLIVFAESSCALHDALKSHYERTGMMEKVVFIRLGNSTRRLSHREWMCDIDDPGAFEVSLSGYEPIGRLYFLAGTGPEHRAPGLDALALSPRQNEIQLLRLVKHLKKENAGQRRIDCYLITRGNNRIGDGAISAYSGGVAGLGYSLAQGDHRFAVRNIDIADEDLVPPGEGAALLNLLLNEAPSDRGDLVTFKAGHRYKRRFLRFALPPDAASGIEEEGVYVIAGGSGTVGSIITRHLTEKYNARIVWIGRKPEDSPVLREKRESASARGRQPFYIQADLTDRDAMHQAVREIRNRHGKINGAVFAGLVFDPANSLAKTTEREFLEIFSVKAAGGVHFYSAFENEDLDFMCFFSSAQAFSFSGAANLSAYASGITFSDAFVRSLGAVSRFPVGTIHWGFWKTALDALSAGTGAARNAGALEDEEGFSCFERFTGLLRQGALSQVVCLKATDAVQQLMGCPEGEMVSCAGRNVGSLIRSLWSDRQAGEGQGGALQGIEQPAEGLVERLLKLLRVQMRGLGLGDGTSGEDTGALRKKAGILEKYEGWLEECLMLLDGRADGKADTAGRTTPDSGESEWKQWDSVKDEYTKDPVRGAWVRLAEHCLRKLPEILQGSMPATEVIFPNSSMELVEGIYKKNAIADYYNTIVAEGVEEYVKQRLLLEPGSRIRMIEIGAGTGGTSAMIFPRLRPYADHLEYRYTDVSPSFLEHAREHYGGANPCLTYGLWNVERPFREQNVETGAYDIVIASNVLHATGDIRRTIGNAKAALARNGILILAELTQKSILATLTFGLLDGWWLYEDRQLRIPGSPLLSPGTWRTVLEEEGFRLVSFPAAAGPNAGQQVIAAESDGIFLAGGYGEAKKEDGDGFREKAGSRSPQPGTVGGIEPSPGDLEAFVKQALVIRLSKSLKVSPDSIDENAAFSDFGVDSITGVSFVQQVNEALGLSLNSAILFDYTTVNRLAAYLLKTNTSRLQAAAGARGGKSPHGDANAGRFAPSGRTVPDNGNGRCRKEEKSDEMDLEKRFFAHEISPAALVEMLLEEFEVNDGQPRF